MSDDVTTSHNASRGPSILVTSQRWRSLNARPEEGEAPVRGEPRWHPILAAVEGPTGTWRMVAPDGTEYGTIELRRVMNGTDLRYKATRGGEVLGWSVTLREACRQVHMAYVRAHGPAARSGAPAPWELADRQARRG